MGLGFIHRFTEPLPRQMTASGLCIECERGLHAREGPPTPRTFDFTAREVAFGLIWAGSGKPWREVGFLVRQRAERLKLSGKGFVLPNRAGNTIADWIELFAPTIFARYEPRHWPKILAVDAATFKTTTLNAKGLPKSGGTHAFHVFAAYGWDDKYESGYVVSMKAQPGFGFNQGTPGRRNGTTSWSPTRAMGRRSRPTPGSRTGRRRSASSSPTKQTDSSRSGRWSRCSASSAPHSMNGAAPSATASG